ncbi:MAG: trehalose-phosphatase [Mycobacteriales bacterium]
MPVTPEGRAGLAALRADPARALIALDFDGTLAPIVTRPADARPLPGALEVLTALAGRVLRLAVISGRPVREVVRLGGLAAVAGIVVVGNYGLERYAEGRLAVAEPDPGIAAARPLVQRLVREAPAGVHLEDKGPALVVHTRPAADPVTAWKALTEPLARIAAEHSLELLPGRLVLELRPPGTDKGRALGELVSATGCAAVCFAGDDVADLPAFRVVSQLRGSGGIAGLTVAASSEETPPELLRAADLAVAGPAGVITFLRALLAGW